MSRRNKASSEGSEDQVEAEWNYWRDRFAAFGTIHVDMMRHEALVDALKDRLAAILDFTNCDATPEGWRELALYLVTEFRFEGRRVINLKSPLDKKGHEGRPTMKLKHDEILWKMKVLIENNGKTRKAAAETVSKSIGGKLASSTLLKMYSERKGDITRPKTALSSFAQYRVGPLHAIEEAAKQLSGDYENDR